MTRSFDSSAINNIAVIKKCGHPEQKYCHPERAQQVEGPAFAFAFFAPDWITE
jgi:hypothetical protein